MHLLLKNKYDQDIAVPFETAALKSGAHLDYDEVTEFAGLAMIENRMSDKHFDFLQSNPQISSVTNGPLGHIIDMPVCEVFNLAAKAKEDGKPSLDLSEYSGKKAYNKWTYPVAGLDKSDEDVEKITQEWMDSRGWFRKLINAPAPGHKMI